MESKNKNSLNNAAIPNLFRKEGLPVNLFRTDNWEIDTMRVINQGLKM